jgi:hypothetical protein
MAMMKQTAIKDNRVLKGLAKLKIRKDLTEREVSDIFRDLITHVNSEEQITEVFFFFVFSRFPFRPSVCMADKCLVPCVSNHQLLSNLPGSEGGLYPVALGLVHPLPEVRRNAVKLVNRIQKTKAGATYMRTLNKYLLLAYDRIRKDMALTADDFA